MALNVGTLSGTLDLDANPFERSLDRSMQSGAQRAQAIGGKMTRSLTLPLVAAGGAAVKMGIDFDTSFSRMVGLAGVPAGEIDQLKESVLDLAGETARSPQELADALYEAASAGLNSAQAMDAVKVAAQGAAAGMGETGDIVGLIASATASYGAEAISAAQATDILTATIRAGRADPQELAGTLGRVLPIASQLGVSFDQVGGTVAYLSNVFGDTNRTVTATQGVLTKLLSPSEQGRKVLEEMGTSVEELHATISKDGLLGALDLLREKGFEGNQEAIAKLFDDIEGRQGALALLADESGTLAEVLDETAGSAGALADAFGEATGTDGQKAKQALVDLQVAAIQAADAIMPFVTAVVGGISDVVTAFSALPDPAQKALVGVLGLFAAMGPLASIGGKIAANWGTLVKGFDMAATSSYGLAGKLGGVAKAGAAVGAAAAALYAVDAWAKASADNVSSVDQLTASLLDLAETGQLSGDLLAITGANFEDLGKKIKVAGNSPFSLFDSAGIREVQEANAQIDTLDKTLANLFSRDPDQARALFDEMAAAAQEQGVSMDMVRERFNDYTDAVAGASNEQRIAAGATDEATGATDDQIPVVEDAATAQQDLADSIQDVVDAYRAQVDPLFAAQDALLSHRDAQEAVTAAEWNVVAAMQERDAAIKEHGEGSAEATEATFALTDAERDLENKQRDVIRSAMDVTTATFELKRMMEEGTVSVEGAAGMLRQWVAQGLLTEAQAAEAAGQLGLVAANARAADGISVNIPVTANTSAWERSIAAIYQRDYPAIRISTGSGGGIPLRHEGGRVNPDMTYLTGGYGYEELFVPDSAGTVFSASETRDMLGGGRTMGGDGGGTTLVADLTVRLDGRKIGSSRTVLEGMDTAKAKRSRNTGGRG